MRIAMVSEHASPLATLGGVDAGGQNVYVSSLAQALAGHGHLVDVYTRRDDVRLPERVQLASGVQVIHVPAGPPRPIPKDELLRWMPDFGDWLAEAWWSVPNPRSAGGLRPDVVHAHFWMSGVAALRATRSQGVALTEGFEIPVVQTFHALGSVKRRFQGLDDSSPPTRIATERMLAATVDQVIATCSDEVAELHALTGSDTVPQDVQVVPCGVDLERFVPTGPATLPMHLLASEPITDASLRLLCIGRLVERKGVDTVVEALAALPEARLVVAGGPAAADLSTDVEALRLRALADDLGVGDRVHLIGRVEQADLPSLLRWTDVVVATPWYEPFGIVPLEAMACGRPLVGSAVGGLLDTVVPEVTGLLVPPREAAALTTALAALRDDPELRQRMGRQGRARALSRYGWNRVAHQIEAAYRTVIDRKAAGRTAADELTLLSAEAL
jgi:D-inositol-3-phosphate glycosyltransferase